MHHDRNHTRVIRVLKWSACCALWFAAAISSTAWSACRTSETEPNNSDTAANSDVCSGTAITGSISNGNDYDWYKLVVTGPGTISISLAHSSGVDFDWFLYAATGSYIAYASTTNNPEIGSKTVTAAGNYFVRVKRYSGTGNYTLAVSGPIAGGTTLPPPTLGTFTVPAKNVGDAAFALTPPTSNSSGAFTFTSSNAAVATISGSTVTVNSTGSSTITANHAATASYAAGSASATFTVSGFTGAGGTTQYWSSDRGTFTIL